MKHMTDTAIINSRCEASRLYAKLASLKPSDDFTRDDIRSAMFLLKMCDDELRSIAAERARSRRA